MTDVSKRAISIVVIKRQRHSRVDFLVAIRAYAIEFADLGIVEGELGVIADQEIQIAVAVIIKPDRASRPAALVLYTGFFGNIGERAVTVVVEQRGARCAGDV